MSGQWIDVGRADGVVDGKTLAVEVDGEPVVIARCGDSFHAIEDRCTHDGEPLAGGEVEDCEIICPRHFARFCLRTGAALSPPAYEPAKPYDVKVEAGRLLLRARH